MGEPIILYCLSCNPERRHQKDRRIKVQSAEIIQFPKNNRTPDPDRREILDRRLNEYPLNRTSLRRSIGRRPFDGKSWFIGTVESAIEEQWGIKEDGEELICPRCLHNT
jgi:hypothetical protein